MATPAATIQTVTDEVLGYIQKNNPGPSQIFDVDESKKSELIEGIKRIIIEEYEQSQELAQNGEDVSKLALPSGRLAAIEHGLDMATYRVNITERVARITFTDGTEFETIQLNTQANIDYAYYMQAASIIIEGVLLVMEVVGVKSPASKENIKKASKELVKEFTTSSAFRQAVETFVKSWASASDLFTKATALFYLLNDTYSLGIMWSLIETLYSGMNQLDWIKTGAIITAQIVAAFATGGLALITKIALALTSAYDFFGKIQHLHTLGNLEKSKQLKSKI